MKKLCPNLDREDGLETVLEVPVPDEIFTAKTGTAKACQSMVWWMKPNYDSNSSPSSDGARNTEIQLLLGVVGAPLIPFPISSDGRSITPNIKDLHIVSIQLQIKFTYTISHLNIT